MSQERFPRRLVAVLYADAAGFSRMTETDEDDTFRRLKACRELFIQRITRHGGQLVDHAGDSVLAVFESAANALACAGTAQAALCHKPEPANGTGGMSYRIGLNLGDVIEDQDGVYGDGVNVAARLGTLAPAGGICLSGSFRDAIGDRLPVDFKDLGEQQLKNIEHPVRAYLAYPRIDEFPDLPAVSPAVASQQDRPRPIRSWLVAGLALCAGLALLWWQYDPVPRPEETKVGSETVTIENTPSIIVLPFQALGETGDESLLIDGITEDIITDLSRLSGLRVIASNTSFSYKGRDVDARDVAKQLGVAYVLDGSVRRLGDRLRINTQLVDAANGFQAWSERYDRTLDDIFAVQDDVTRNIVEALSLRLTRDEEQILAAKPTLVLEAYDHFLQGQRYFQDRTREGSDLAKTAYREAIRIDPDYARAYGALAVTLSVDYSRGWTDTPNENLDRALELAQKAADLDPDQPQVLWALGYTYFIRKDFPEATEILARAVELAPSYADGYGLLALIHNAQGNAREAMDLITRGMELNPYYTWDYPYNLGRAHYTLGEYDQAIEAFNRALERNENASWPRLFLAASLEASDRHDDAEWEIEQALVSNPNVSVAHLRNAMPLMEGPHKEKLLADLRSAGLPERH